ncbi:chemotaxis protein CheA [Sphingobium fluviale]|uniref:Chemotaxis protein CheA n=1 Tax=Sphingobium fluviale TaxID=2506423 RepID=A0A4Q1KM54_9SPHN|nr:ATP-binding protein [Sphingobium fluviale]RXR30958.1 chemotaxis protein CheA [Sphingobium fluviale]
MEELLSDFVAETQEGLEALANVVVALEADPSDRVRLDELFRFFHTVKGSSGFLNLPRFEKLSHAAEDVLSEMRGGEGTPDAATITAVLAIMDRIAELCAAIESGDTLDRKDDEVIIATLRQCVALSRGDHGQGGGDGDAGNADNEEAQARLPGAARTIRLPLMLIDQLMNGVSDMVLARNELSRKLRVTEPEPELEAAFERLSSCIADMRDTISKTRMQRVDRLFMAIPRMVRDLSRELGKKIELVLEGGDVEMDREMVEAVIDPLTHIVRNSIDHGIETPEQRRAAGKREAGQLRVSAHQSGSQIVIEVADDGRGINTDAVVAKVVSAGLMNAQEAALLGDQAKLDLIFTPGLSTAQAVTAISGRGVGMDIVRANIERIGGLISLSSEPGRGLTITMRVPLTLTIIPGLILNAGGINFAIPRSAVVEILHDNNPTVFVSRLGGGQTATIRDTRYSMIDLEEVIGMPMLERHGPRSLMLVRSTGGNPYILGVAAVENHEELVIRPAAPMVMAAGIYAGMTLPDNGQPMLLLDAGGIAEVAQLPLIFETNEQSAKDHAGAALQGASYSGLRYIELSGEERIIRLSLVERVEDIALDHFGVSAGRPYVTLGGRIVNCARAVGEAECQPGMREVTCLRIRDDLHELCYPIRMVLDIEDVSTELDMSARHGLVAGLVLLNGRQVEVVDSMALLALAGMQDIPAEGAVKPTRCLIGDADDPWNREILAPLLTQAGFEVVWAGKDMEAAQGDVVVLTLDDAQAEAMPLDAPVVRLRRASQPGGPEDASIYRYDQDALIGAIAALGRGSVTA